ncbi:MAG: N-acetylneuraminate synthase family protein [Desulfobacterales bacterium]|nr:MAG: N-acetylneuraminate synthase family protein [Desulfobacterales bacterium]
MSQIFKMGDQTVGPGQPCLIIAEVAQAHDGSLGTAHAFIDAIAAAGANAVKFQTHIASAESTPDEPWRIKFSPQDATRYDYWKRMEFTEEQWVGLKRHADERGLLFLSSPFSFQAVDLLNRVGVAAWKIPSGETTNVPMLDNIIATGLPIILSTGMSPLGEIDDAVNRVKDRGVPLAVLQCTTAYPCPPEKIGINMISFFKKRYKCAVGLSDHSGTIYAGLAAAAIGVQILEVHLIFNRQMFGPDVPASITVDELRQLVDGIRFIEKMVANPVDKEAMAREAEELRNMFTKSIVARRNIEAGTTLTSGDLALKKPGTGIPAARLTEIIGRRLKRSIAADTLISEEDFD